MFALADPLKKKENMTNFLRRIPSAQLGTKATGKQKAERGLRVICPTRNAALGKLVAAALLCVFVTATEKWWCRLRALDQSRELTLTLLCSWACPISSTSCQPGCPGLALRVHGKTTSHQDKHGRLPRGKAAEQRRPEGVFNSLVLCQTWWNCSWYDIDLLKCFLLQFSPHQCQ